MTGEAEISRAKTVGAFLGRYDPLYQHVPPLAQTKHVSLENLLFRWGIRSRRLGTKVGSPLAGAYQRLVLLLAGLVYLRAIVLVLRPFIEKYLSYGLFWRSLGDFWQGTVSPHSIDYYNAANLFVSQYTFFIALFCFRKRKLEDRWQWLRFFTLFQHKIGANDLMMTEFMVQLVWKQFVFTLRVYNLLSFGLIGAGSAFLIYSNLAKLQALDPTTIIWLAVLIVWLYYATAFIMGFLCIFRVICIYMDLRIRKLAQDSFLLSQHSKEINNQDIGYVVYSLLREFDFSCRELDRFNKFWRFFMLVFYVPGFVYIFFCLTLLIIKGPHMGWVDLIVCLAIFFGTTGMWTYSVLLAGMVPTRAKRLYANLNKVCLLPLPSFVVTKLDSFVKRFSGRAIGFDCYQMFYVTHEFLYEVVLFSGTSYVLLIDAIIRSMIN